jgi:hypothetical protein
MTELRDYLEISVKIANESGSPSDYRALFSALHEEELFFSTSRDGQRALLTPVGDNQKAVRLVTPRTSPLLGETYAGIKWEDALHMVTRMPEVSGIIVQNSGDQWVAIDQEAVKALLSLRA